MTLFKNKPTRALILIMCALVLIGLVIAKTYYSNQNKSVDPRIREARELYKSYNAYAQAGDFDSVFFLMDTIETIYAKHKHYKESYEVGVLYNNRAAGLLTIAMHLSDDLTIEEVDSLFNLAKENAQKSISIYENWLANFGELQDEKLKDMIKADFYTGLDSYNDADMERFLKNRISDIEIAQHETNRRLSVSYTNLGIILRHELKYDQAVLVYKKALDLWDRNLTARNNLNVLLNRPKEKRNVIQTVFPPDKDK